MLISEANADSSVLLDILLDLHLNFKTQNYKKLPSLNMLRPYMSLGFVVDKVALGQVFSEYCGFPMEAAGSSRKLINIYQTVWSHIAEDWCQNAITFRNYAHS
jgi:hypothetical protein